MQEIRPQKGPQEDFLSSSADIVIYGGAAGGGKTWALLMEPLRHINNPEFGAVIFRREATQITNEGGLWDTATQIYPLLGGVPRVSPKMRFTFDGAKIGFAHLNRDDDVLGWQGSQIPLICFDELTHFTRKQFFYMLSRNRSTCGIRPYIRATTNPDADSWVADFIAWWIDQDSGLPIISRSGVVRYFIRVNDEILWGGSAAELAEKHNVSEHDCKSLTFIPASIHDNQELLQKDPGYLANLKALSLVERERLLGGNWKIKPAAGLYFPRGVCSVIIFKPGDIKHWVRSWDLAATEPGESNPDPDYTVGVLKGKYPDGRFVVADVIRVRLGAHKVRELIKRTAVNDGKQVKITIPEDPGQAGKEQAQSYVSMLAGYSVTKKRASKDKISRAEPFAAQWQAGNVDIMIGQWNESFISEMEQFPDAAHDDCVDSCSDAFAELNNVLEGPVGYHIPAL